MFPSLIRWSGQNRFLVIFLAAGLAFLGIRTLPHQQVDALPDVSETQVILYAKWDQPADLVEAQVTYPLTTALLGTPQVKAVRGYTEAGYSLIYVLFEDDVSLAGARSRVSDFMAKAISLVPSDARLELGPDATGVGWIFQYAIVDDTGKHSLEEMRELQDWSLRYPLQSVPGVAEVATIGGLEKEYQVTVDPLLLEDRSISLKSIITSLRNSNMDVGARVIEFSGKEYTVRGRGLAHTIEDLERVIVYPGHSYKSDMSQTNQPIRLRDIAHIQILPRNRRGVSDLDGKGEAVGGIVVMRQGENAPEVIRHVKERLASLQMSLPQGVHIISTYDRSEFIGRAMNTMWRELCLAVLIVALLILISLHHLPSSLVTVAIIPATLFIALLPIYWRHVNFNIMSMAGIILSIGVLVDGAIVEVENGYRSVSIALARPGSANVKEVLLAAMQEVAPAVFLSLFAIGVTFLPVFALTGYEGRLFRPLAAAKTAVMVVGAVLTLTLAPALRMSFHREVPFAFHPQWLARIMNTLVIGNYRDDSQNSIWSSLAQRYERVLRVLLQIPRIPLALAVVAAITAVPVYLRLNQEFMPPLNEESILYMPTTLPGISASYALQILQKQDAAIASFPEVARVFGKAGRAETATDPAPLSMIETTILLRPKEQWRERKRWYSAWAPEWLKNLLLRRIASDRISYEMLISELNRATALPGVANSWTMPIRGRTDMLTTGARTTVALKVLGSDLLKIEEVANRLAAALRTLPGTRSVFAEPLRNENFVDIEIDRDNVAANGLLVSDVQEVIAAAIGGTEATVLYEGRARYPVTVRYPTRYRSSIEQLERITVPAENGSRIPLLNLARIRQAPGAGMIRTDGGQLASYVFVDTASGNIAGYISRAQALVSQSVTLPQGCSLEWTGEFENMLKARVRLQFVIPATVLLLVLLLYMNTRSWVKTGIVMLAVPFSLIGAVWLLYVLGYNVSVATWVGVLALIGLDAETGVFMLLFLDLAYDSLSKNRSLTVKELEGAVIAGSAKRLRPKLMTVAAAATGLLPTMISSGTGSDVAKRIVAPMMGGLMISFLLELLIYPPLYYLWRKRSIR